MFGEHHDLMHEFPEHKERIATLRATNPEFARLMDEYDALDEQILRMEQRVEPTSDDHEEQLKKKRVRLKDKLYAILRAG